MRKRTITVTAAVLLALAAIALAACGEDDSSADPAAAADAPDYGAALAAAPPKLRALYADGGKLRPGGLDAFSEQLDAVAGYPVVVNNWASWCGPCRTEWPWFQKAAAEHLDEVAFMGVATDDEDDAIDTFLSNYEVPYPTFADPDKKLADVTGFASVGGLPNTLFYDADGELLYAHQGVYPDQATLEADIGKYALGES
ncbi:MAG TPA: TlpA disulfide reductase family protein [Solirubrobacterales bacterium]|nr:TlpA disulfide reductase family protein [Solirubrobacterales bacterium]